MKFLIAALLALSALQARAGDAEVIEAAKKMATREFKELSTLSFRKLVVINAPGGQIVCGEVSAKNHPSFAKFYASLASGNSDRKGRQQWRDELVDAVCDPPSPTE